MVIEFETTAQKLEELEVNAWLVAQEAFGSDAVITLRQSGPARPYLMYNRKPYGWEATFYAEAECSMT